MGSLLRRCLKSIPLRSKLLTSRYVDANGTDCRRRVFRNAIFPKPAGGKTEPTGSGTIDPALVDAAAPFFALPFHAELRAKRAEWAPNVHWSGKRSLVSFPTANYPPLFYLPSAAGILVGRELTYL